MSKTVFTRRKRSVSPWRERWEIDRLGAAARTERDSGEVHCHGSVIEGAMIEKIIEGSARNKFLDFSHGDFLQRLGNLGAEEHAARCDTRSLRCPGHRLHALDGKKSDHHGRPGHLSDRDDHDFRSQGEIRAGLFRLRLLLRLHHFRRRHRHLLGEKPRSRISESGQQQASPGRDADAWAPTPAVWVGSFSTRWSMRRASMIWLSCAVCKIGICAIRSAASKEWRRSRVSAASCASIK